MFTGVTRSHGSGGASEPKVSEVRAWLSPQPTKEVLMPIRTAPWPAGTPCWVDLAVPDVDAAKEFYAAVLSWTYVDSGEEFGHYQMCQRDGHFAAGIGPQQSPDQPPAWTTYLASDAVDRSAQQIADNGGEGPARPLHPAAAGPGGGAPGAPGGRLRGWAARGEPARPG